jgi:hypothetical protein
MSRNESMTTGFYRACNGQSHLELHLLRNFRKYAEAGVGIAKNYWDWLSMAQHHGLPTRLLDWTYSPYVALHFVTAETARMNEDGVVWCIDFVKAHQLLPEMLRTRLAQEGADVFTTEMMAVLIRDLPHLDEMADADPFLLFFEPPSIDARIVNQFALFSAMPGADIPIERWLTLHPEMCKKIVIPGGELKWEIRDKLDQANITERVLFPGLDGLSSWLKRHYMTRGVSMDEV